MNKVIPISVGIAAPDAGSGTALTRWPLLGWLLRRGYLMTGLRMVTLGLLAVAVTSGLVADDARVGLSVLLMWGIFWPLLTSVVTPSLGNAYCAVCPHGFVGKWLGRIGLRRSFPKRLRGVWVGLVIIVLCYWVISYAMPGALSASTRTTAWYFLAFSVVAFGFFYVFKDMAWCKHVCPLGRVLATHGKVGVLQITTDQSACRSCRGFECAKACSYHLSPFRFEQRNNMDACTLCTDCVTACSSVDLVVRRPGQALNREITGQDRHEMWVFLVILAVAGVGVQFLHGLQHTPLKEHLPWSVAGAWLHGVVPLDAQLFDLGRFLALALALVLTVAMGAWAYGKAARVTGRTWQQAANGLACALAPLAVIGLIPHAVTMFATRDAHALVNETGVWLGLGWIAEPLAQRGDVWLGWLGVLPYLAMLWTLWLVWQRAGLLAASTRQRWVVWAYGSVPVWLYIGVFVIKLGAMWFMPAAGHQH